MNRAKELIEKIYKDYPEKDSLEYFVTGSVAFNCASEHSDYDIVVRDRHSKTPWQWHKNIDCYSKAASLYDFTASLHDKKDDYLLSSKYSMIVRPDEYTVVNIILSPTPQEFENWKLATCKLRAFVMYTNNITILYQIQHNKKCRVYIFEQLLKDSTLSIKKLFSYYIENK